MGDNINITSYRIPYDIDPVWNGGCEGTDSWKDNYGNHVIMLFSESGSAYVCPDNPEGDWRIYADRSGQAWRLPMWPDGPVSEDAPIDAEITLADILTCGIENSPATQNSIQTFITRNREFVIADAAAIFDGALICEGNWCLKYSGENVVLKENCGGSRGNHGSLHRYSLGESPFVTASLDEWHCTYYPGELGFPEAECTDSLTYYLAPSHEISNALDIFVNIKDEKDFMSRMAIEVAAALFNSALQAHEEIATFEDICQGTSGSTSASQTYMAKQTQKEKWNGNQEI